MVHPRRGKRYGLMCRITWVVLFDLAMVFVPIPFMSAGDAARRGHAVVDQWCRTCHLRPTDAADPDMAPPFENIVQRPRRDRDYLRNFLAGDHFPMTIFRLYESEKADVVAYLMDLQDKGAEHRIGTDYGLTWDCNDTIRSSSVSSSGDGLVAAAPPLSCQCLSGESISASMSPSQEKLPTTDLIFVLSNNTE